jgi:surface antigen
MLGALGEQEPPMPVRRPSYIGEDKPRQSPPFYRGLSVAVLALSVGGCASIGLPLGELSSAETDRGAMLANADGAAAVDPSDWEAVRRIVSSAPADAAPNRLSWSNPTTGSTGAVSILALADARGGAFCRPFATTINDARGIRRYRGEACRQGNGMWRLRTVTPDDAVLS